ncbi:MAG: NADH-quinone oxidoreductase subunit NuoK [Armatimonadota bacterium]
MNGVPLAAFIGLSLFMFSTGVVGVILRRNPIVIFMCIELMLNAVNLAFIAFARYRFSGIGNESQGAAGQMMVVFIMAVAAAEVAVGLGIIMAIYRLKENIDVDELNLLKG